MTNSNVITTHVSKRQRAVLYAIIFAALICWSPFNLLAYTAPFLVLGLMVIWGRDFRLLNRAVIGLCLWITMTVFYPLINSNFQFANALISLVTWAGLVVLLILPTSRLSGNWLYLKAQKVAWIILAIEAVWGIVQGLYGYTQTGTFDLATGDFIEGTIHPWLGAELAYSNVMFAINIAILLLFLFPSLIRKLSYRKIFVYALGLLAFVMASVVHVILFLGIAVGAALFINYGARLRLSRLIRIGVLFGGLFLIAWIFLPKNLSHIKLYGRQLLQGEVPKTQSVLVALQEMPEDNWYLPLIGLGPGQYASRAGLISSGRYFGGRNPRQISYLPNQFTESQRKYLLPLWDWYLSNPYFGSTQVPYFSWLAIYTEWGLFGWLIVVIILVRIINSIRRLERNYHFEKWSLVAAVALFFLLGFQENNWEVPQAWFSGLLFFKVMYGYCRQA